MKKNMGKMDRVIRLAVAIIILSIWSMGLVKGSFGSILLVIAAIFLVTASWARCPLYSVLGINTCENGQNPAKR